MTNQQLWQSVLGNLEVSLSRGNFSTWFKNTAIIDRQNDTITVSVPNVFIHKWVSGKFHPELLKIIKQIDPEIREIKYQIGQQKPQASTGGSPKGITYTAGIAQPSVQAPPPQVPATTSYNLNPKYTFETFIIGKNNELAHAASTSVAKDPGGQYNPLFIYGGVGLGKTHLMHAVGHKQLERQPQTRVVYVSAEKFTNDYVSAIQTKRMEEFKKRYRSADLLLVDDIQFIAGKEGIQEEFFHTFNELRNANKQIILTSDRLPQDIPGIEQRLVSRFVQGMVADVQAPDLETRMAILRTKAGKKGTTIDEEILYYIAENIINNIRELEGALNRLVVLQEMQNRPLTLDQAKQFMVNMLNTKKKSINLKKIASYVAEFYSISVDDLLKQSRRKEYVKPRQIAMYLARKELNSSFPMIGEFFGGRDHTTVMHGVEKIENVVSTNEIVKQELDLILDKLYAS